MDSRTLLCGVAGLTPKEARKEILALKKEGGLLYKTLTELQEKTSSADPFEAFFNKKMGTKTDREDLLKGLMVSQSTITTTDDLKEKIILNHEMMDFMDPPKADEIPSLIRCAIIQIAYLEIFKEPVLSENKAKRDSLLKPMVDALMHGLSSADNKDWLDYFKTGDDEKINPDKRNDPKFMTIKAVREGLLKASHDIKQTGTTNICINQLLDNALAAAKKDHGKNLGKSDVTKALESAKNAWVPSTQGASYQTVFPASYRYDLSNTVITLLIESLVKKLEKKWSTIFTLETEHSDLGMGEEKPMRVKILHSSLLRARNEIRNGGSTAIDIQGNFESAIKAASEKEGGLLQVKGHVSSWGPLGALAAKAMPESKSKVATALTEAREAWETQVSSIPNITTVLTAFKPPIPQQSRTPL